MFDVISAFWAWLVGALAAGALTGYLVKRPPRESGVAAWLVWAGLAFGAGLAAALLGVFAGRAGLGLESALAAFAAYILGSAAGTAARGGSMREHEGWALGLIPAGLLWWGANLFAAPGVEAELKKQALAALERAGGNGAGVEVAGRDVSLPKSVADLPGVASALANLSGVRRVATIDAVTIDAATAESAMETQAPKDSSGDKSVTAQAPAEKGWADPGPGVPAGGGEEMSGAGLGGKDKDGADSSAVAAGAARRPPSAAKAGAPSAGKPSAGETAPRIGKDKAGAILAALPAKGELDAAACQAALSATVAREKIQFRSASASIRLVSAKVLDQLAALLQRCPNAKVEIGGHTDNVGAGEDNDALSQRRADRVMEYLAGEGVARGRLTGVGYGAHRPVASNDSEDGRADNRRIEFTVK